MYQNFCKKTFLFDTQHNNTDGHVRWFYQTLVQVFNNVTCFLLLQHFQEAVHSVKCLSSYAQITSGDYAIWQKYCSVECLSKIKGTGELSIKGVISSVQTRVYDHLCKSGRKIAAMKKSKRNMKCILTFKNDLYLHIYTYVIRNSHPVQHFIGDSLLILLSYLISNLTNKELITDTLMAKI